MSINPSPDLFDGLFLRIRSYAWRKLRGKGVSIVAVRLVFQDGCLVGWADPEAVSLEPCGNAPEARLLAVMMGEKIVGQVDTLDEAEPEIEVVAPAK